MPRNTTMHAQKTIWILEEYVVDEPSEITELPELRHLVERERHDDDLGVRSLLEHPEVLRDIARFRK
jgi:hypothetical protein